MTGDDRRQRQGEQAAGEDGAQPSRGSARLWRREVGLYLGKVAGVHGGVNAPGALLELVEAEASGGGVRAQPFRGLGALAIADAHELSGRRDWVV
jgi:hypothetical protein